MLSPACRLGPESPVFSHELSNPLGVASVASVGGMKLSDGDHAEFAVDVTLAFCHSALTERDSKLIEKVSFGCCQHLKRLLVNRFEPHPCESSTRHRRGRPSGRRLIAKPSCDVARAPVPPSSRPTDRFRKTALPEPSPQGRRTDGDELAKFLRVDQPERTQVATIPRGVDLRLHDLSFRRSAAVADTASEPRRSVYNDHRTRTPGNAKLCAHKLLF